MAKSTKIDVSPSISATATAEALNLWNSDFNQAWTVGTNWSNVNTEFETFVNKYLFPKITETLFATTELGNKYEFLAKEKSLIGQFSEEMVIMDTVPVDLNLANSELNVLKTYYPRIATKLYGSGIMKKEKFTLNNNDTRLNFLTLGDAVSYAVSVYRKKISNINFQEEQEITANILDYWKFIKEKREVTTYDEMASALVLACLNVQSNSSSYNETAMASGGNIGRYTTQTPLDKLIILTTDDVKAYFIDKNLGNKFHVNGVDLTDRMISFDKFGGVYKLTQDVTIANASTVSYFASFVPDPPTIGTVIPKGSVFTFDITGLAEFSGAYTEINTSLTTYTTTSNITLTSQDTVNLLNSMGNGYAVGSVIPSGTVFYFDISNLTEFSGNFTVATQQNNLFALVMDIDSIRYKRDTQNLLKQPFYNPDRDEWNYYLHYYSFKAISPFFNKIAIYGNIT